jgi:hypothetical protein
MKEIEPAAPETSGADAGVAEQPAARPARWSLSARLAFRLCFVYFSLYVLTTQMLGAMIPPGLPHFRPIEQGGPMLALLQWSAARIFHITATPVVLSGSGDKYLNWIAAAWLLAFSLLAAALWSILGRKRGQHTGLLKWFRVFMRFAVGATFIGYGFGKVVPLQMPYPQLTRLVEPYGNFSMMGVLWYSIGASRPYEIFVGTAEAVGGILLFIPRTALLGALLCLADAIEVFVLNMTYDVPVKLLSFHLILMSLFLLAPDVRRLMNVFLGRAAVASDEPALARTRKGRGIITAVQIVLGAWLVAGQVFGAMQAWYRYGGGVANPPLYGIWNIDEMKINGQMRAPLVTDYERWRRMIVQPAGGATTVAFQRMDETLTAFQATINAASRAITLSRGNYSAGTLLYQQPDEKSLIADGTIDGRQLHLRLSPVDIHSFVLSGPKFHWIQEFPVNR